MKFAYMRPFCVCVCFFFRDNFIIGEEIVEFEFALLFLSLSQYKFYLVRER